MTKKRAIIEMFKFWDYNIMHYVNLLFLIALFMFFYYHCNWTVSRICDFFAPFTDLQAIYFIGKSMQKVPNSMMTRRQFRDMLRHRKVGTQFIYISIIFWMLSPITYSE
ncbi:hypothetical protein [Candidatus Deianiraea vastatrix]|uniref:Uncharacterized protein n=1 Tax=Candidatus Deianiraea vastatrix TaxID=2163644 RepID=A0A5B8XEB3_9RICK|nr:hypothetical protein [Candidatus Deianiraea vastatrix]QED23580.1 hypothetical protein Deia_00792 [Candidatus Deianiraea vastatrix]